MRWFFAKTRRSRTKYGRRSFRKSRKNTDLYLLFVVACPILLMQNYLLPVFCGVKQCVWEAPKNNIITCSHTNHDINLKE